jgi:hypothetical protein
MAWPPDELESKWRPADTMWDGTSRVDHGNEYTDYVRTADGHLFAFGHPTTAGVEDFEALVAELAAEWHDCAEEASEQETLAVDGTDGILATYQCGPTPVLRWIGVRDGVGMAVILLVTDGADVDQARAHFAERLAADFARTT